MDDSNLTDKIPPIVIRVVVWALLFGALALLRSFFLLLFLTFVFGYIQLNAVNRLQGKISNRTVRAVIAALLLLSVIVTVGAFIIPRVKEQASLFADRYPKYIQAMDQAIIGLSSKYSVLESIVSDQPIDALPSDATWDPRLSPTASFIQQLVADKDAEGSQHGLKNTIDTIRNVGGYLLGIASAFLLSLLFSFLIVLDFPNLTEAVRGLRNTRIRFIYDEVADSIYMFATVMGRALEAQLFIALLNTLLTGIGLYVLGLGGKSAFLLVVVFFCSFIPVAGVFISSVPICLIALQEMGWQALFLAIALITIVHLVEAYILNPRIYGHHLRINPVIVLIILTIAGKIFHVWGLVLGVPLCTYIFGHAIRYPTQKQIAEKLVSQGVL